MRGHRTPRNEKEESSTREREKKKRKKEKKDAKRPPSRPWLPQAFSVNYHKQSRSIRISHRWKEEEHLVIRGHKSLGKRCTRNLNAIACCRSATRSLHEKSGWWKISANQSSKIKEYDLVLPLMYGF